MMLLAGCHRPHATLNFTAQDEGHRLVVRGETSLPDQAPLLIQLQKPPDMSTLIESSALVRDHRFTAVMPIPPTLAEGPYAMRVFFSPSARMSTPAVQEAVGAHGEKLRGPQVHRDPGGDLVLEDEEPVWIGPPGV